MRLATILTSAMAAVAGGWAVWRSGILTRKATASAPDPESLEPAFRPEDVKVSATARASHAWARPIVESAAALVLQRAPTLAELQYGQAIGSLETSYGKGWVRCPKGCDGQCDISGAQASNNWGAVQAKGSDASFQWCDSHPDGSTYKQRFRSYETPKDGAADMLGHVFSRRPMVAKALASKGATIYRASLAMRRAVYYGGFCPKAVARFGPGIAIPSYRDPDRDEGTRACEREAVEMHAKRVNDIVRAIAASTGDKWVIPLGTFDDAMAWYKAEKERKA